MSRFDPGARYKAEEYWEDMAPDQPHLYRTFCFERTSWNPGEVSIRWSGDARYSIPTPAGPVYDGGMLATVLDTVMGMAAWSLLDDHAWSLTLNLRVDFVRPCNVGALLGSATVRRRAGRHIWTDGVVTDDEGRPVAEGNCIQVLRVA